MSLGESDQLARLVRHYRLTAGLSQEELAERTSLSARTISDFERGLRKFPRLETIRMLADGLELSPSERAALIAAARPELGTHPSEQSNQEKSRVDVWPAGLPRASGALIGRERERSDLVSMLSSGSTRLVTLTGPGGVGKTKLALAVAREMTPLFDGGVGFVALAPVRDPSLVVPVIAHTLGVQGSSDRSLIDRIAGVLANRRSLLLLDNMEQVPEAATEVAALLAASSELKILVTSRGALRLSGEHRYPVPPLRLPGPSGEYLLKEAAESAAVALFVERAHMAQPDFELTETNVPAVVEICRRLDGLPLAIELAAARTSLLPPAALLARMERRLPLLTGGPRDLPERLQTMHAAIAWSYELLSPDEQSAFRRLAIFDGGFTLEAAESVLAAGSRDAIEADLAATHFDRLAALIDRGLVWQAEQPDGDARFGMLETIREFGLEELSASGETEPVHQAHASWFLAVAEALDSGGEPSVYRELDRFERELPNFRVVLAWAEEIEDTHLGLKLSKSLFRLWALRSHRSEGRDWLERALARDSGEPSEDRAAALVDMGIIQHDRGNIELGASYLNEGLELAQALAHRRTIVVARAFLATAAVDIGDVEQASQLFGKIEASGEEPADWIDFPSFVLVNHGLIARQRDDPFTAMSYFTQALERSGRQGEIYYRALAAEMLGLTQCECGEYQLAATNLLGALDDWRTVGTKESLIDWLAMAATMAAAVGEPDRSSRWFGALEAHVEIYGFNFPKPEQERFERIAQRVRTGPSDPNWAAGHKLSLDQVIDEAAAWLDDSAFLSFHDAASPTPR